MVNEISTLSGTPVRVGSGEGRGGANAAPSAATPEQNDSVHLTESARSLQQAEAAAREAPDVDEARVAEIRSAMVEGRYSVDLDALADRLLDDEALRP